ncbi:MAG TPA: GGDEF domain-containing protein [Candidatus Bathyarchaeia archaeon]|jgi:diguanylate cyclase (GGDEF)-like protein|nr:GGDEF domain-containing protein [Candidatus Bathyarchaeia archaeon]
MPRNLATLRWLNSLITPGAWLLLAAWALQHEEPARLALASYVRFFCFGALAGAALVSWYYDQGRVLFSALVVLLTLWGQLALPASADVSKLAAALLLPLNLALFASLPERGTITLGGLWKMVLIATQTVGVVMLGQLRGGWLEASLRWGQDPAGATRIPLTQQLSFAAAALTLLGLAVFRRTRVEPALLWALLATFLGLRRTGQDSEPLFYFAAAGLILVYAALEHGYEIAHRDELTGLPGRRTLRQVMLQLGSRYAVAMCDVDHFKNFNDTFGHEAGDQVLRFIGSKLSQVRGGARAFRYGGEEFTVVFPGRTAEEAQPFVESLREAIATSGFGLRAPGRPEKKPEHASGAHVFVTITISIGVAESSRKLSTPELVLEAADTALYRAKESGRNCVRLADTLPA